MDEHCVFSYPLNMSEQMPDRLSIDPASPYFNGPLIQRGVGIRLNGVEKTNVEEYCLSEGWIRVSAGKSRDRRGRPLTIKLHGTIEAYVKEEQSPAETATPSNQIDGEPLT